MRQVERGAPLQETTKGSLEYSIYEIGRAFATQFGYACYDYCIVDTFADHVILRDWELPADEYWLVGYTQTAGVYTFVPQPAWERVQLAYTPARQPLAPEVEPAPPDGELDDAKKAGGRRGGKGGGKRCFVERTGPIVITEAAGDAPRRVRGIGMTAGAVNENMRRYPAPVIADAVARVQAQLNNPAGRIGRGPLLGEAEHPTDKGQTRPLWLNTVFVWDAIAFDGRQVTLEGSIVPTSQGQDAIALLDHGVLPGLSLRGYGTSTFLKESGVIVEEVEFLDLEGWDAVLDPADRTADLVLADARRAASPSQQEASSMRIIHPVRLSDPDDGAAVQTGASTPPALPDADRAMLDRIADRERRQAIADAITQALDGAPYSDAIRQSIAGAVQALDLADATAVPAAVERQRAVADAAIAAAELQAMGRPAPRGRVISDVAQPYQIPDYARGQGAILDSIRRATGELPQLASAARMNTPAGRLALDVLAKFDATHRSRLIEESRHFQEAEAASDLNLPYTVSRTIIAEALPRLVAANVFDVQSVDPAPTVNVPYETFAAETGLTGTVTAATLTNSNPTGSWVALAHAHLTPGSVTVTNSGASTTYTEGTDYVIDYPNGKFMSIAAAGTIANGASLKITYGYTELRNGEGAAIQRGKQTLAFYSLPMAADRIAAQINSETVVFSRAALGYDAVGRTIQRLVFEVQRKIDRGMMYLALAESLRIANNSGGTWTAASDTLDKLVQLIGTSKVKVTNRYFEPTAILASETNADRIANWSAFGAAYQRPDAAMNAAGMVTTLKGLPVYSSTEFGDGYVLALNRAVASYRSGQPLLLKGPYPSYDASGFLIAADQWYLEEYNGKCADPGHTGKAAHVVIG